MRLILSLRICGGSVVISSNTTHQSRFIWLFLTVLNLNWGTHTAWWRTLKYAWGYATLPYLKVFCLWLALIAYSCLKILLWWLWLRKVEIEWGGLLILLLVRCGLFSARCWTSVPLLAIRCVMYLASISINPLLLITFLSNKVLLFHSFICCKIFLLNLLLTKTTICSCFLFYLLVTWHLWVERWHPIWILAIDRSIFLLVFFIRTVLTWRQ